MTAWRWLRAAGFALLVGGYTVLAHLSNTGLLPKRVGATLAVGPLLFLAAGLAWRFLHPVVALAMFLGLALVIVRAWPALLGHYPVVMLIQQVGMWALSCAGFALSLMPGRMALCTLWADKVHGPLSPEVLRYTRAVTAGWASFFALMGMTSIALFCFASMRTWSLFENFLMLPLVAVVFVLEYAIRWIALPELHEIGIFEAVRHYHSHR